MRITTRLRITSTATIAALAVLVSVSIWSLIEFKNAKNDYVLAEAIQDNFFERASFRDQYFLYREDRARVLWYKNKEASDGLLRQAEAQFHLEEDKHIVERLRKNIEDTAFIFHRIVNNTATLNTAIGNRQVYDELDKRLYSQLLLKATAVRETSIALVGVSARRVEHTYQRLTLMIGLFAATLAIVTILFLRQIGRLIRKRLMPLHEGAKIIADGNLDYRIKSDSTDEFSELAVSINAMTDRLSEEIRAHIQAEQTLAESESRFREIFNAVSDAIFIHDAETGRIVDVNRRMCEMYGITREEALACDSDDLSAGTPPYSSAEAIEKIRLIHTEGAQTFDWLARARDGRLFWVEVSLKFALIGSQQRILAVVRDITDRKEFEEELKRSNAELEQFSYAVSHDMRQPLRMISSYLQLLELSLADQLDGEKRDYFNFAIDGAKRIDQMLVSLLEYSRVGRLGEPPTLIDSHAVLDEALQFLQPVIAEAQVGLNITGEWPSILASHDEILRLLQNLIGNAVKYRIAGRIPEITVTGERVKNEWHLCVTDNGVGIIPDQIKRLFKVFQRLQTRTAYEGTGIGLALCRKIAEHHKGRIWAESAGEGQGSRFCVALPVSHEKIMSTKGRIT